jgi:hypothetical protein
MMKGPGDHLANLIDWATPFLMNKDQCASCRKRVKLMNIWGPDGCEINRETILEWLRRAAHESGVPFNSIFANLMISEAIRRARNEKTPPPVS